MFLQIANAIAVMIQSGHIAPGSCLPPTRQWAALLNVNRNTIIAAYEKLRDWDMVQPIARKGFYTNGIISKNESTVQDMPALFTFKKFERKFELPDFRDKHSLAKFDVGMADPRLAPINEFNSTYKRIFNQKARRSKSDMSLSRLNTEDKLTNSIQKLLVNHRGISSNPFSLSIIRGNHLALYLILQVLNPSATEIILVESPGNTWAWEVFNAVGVRVVPIEVDSHGIKISQIQTYCRTYKVKAVYVCPKLQFPTTTTLHPERGTELLALSKKYEFAIIECDWEIEFSITDPRVPTLYTMDNGNNSVIYMTTLSRILPVTSLLEVVAGPPNFIYSLNNLYTSINQQGDNVMEETVAELLREGILQRYIRKSSTIYKKRITYAATLLDQHLKPYIFFNHPPGGMAMWVTFTNSVNVKGVFQWLQKRNISIISGRIFSFTQEDAAESVRLGIASLNEHEIEKGIMLLKEAVFSNLL